MAHRTRILRHAGGATLLAVLLLLATHAAPTATADPCDHGRGYGAGRGCGTGSGYGGWRNGRFGRSFGRSLGHRSNCHDGLHEARFIARGQGWQLLRRHVHRIRIQDHHVHPAFYFQRRWPCRSVATPDRWGGLGCVGHDFPITECPLVAASLGGDGELLDGIRDLTPADRLDRGMERFFRSAYEEAAEDFAFVAKHDPEDARGRYGLFVSRVMQKDWKGAISEMRELEALDALDAKDRLEMESCFHDPKAFGKFQEGLDALAQWSFHDVDVQIVTGWAYAVTGDEEKARTHIKAALRFAPKHDVANHMLATLDGDAAQTRKSEPAETQPDPLPRHEPAENLAAREE